MDAGHIFRWLIYGWTVLVGAVVGSFLNVVIARVPAGESIVSPRSRCPQCKAFIRWYDNVPVVSWLVLRARCRACGSRISARYPAVEALGAAAALVAVSRHGLSGAAAAEFAFAAALFALAFIDIDTWLLPNAITWPLIAFGLVMGWLGVTPAGSALSAAYGAGLGFAAFGLVAWLGEKVFRKEALGFGDVWLLAGLGAFMGPAGLLPIVLLASIQGATVGLALLALGKGEPGTEAPSRPTDGGRGAPALRRDGDPATARRDADAVRPGADVTRARSGLPDARPEEDDWVPPRHAVPFGPFLVAGALEWLWFGGLLARAVPVLQLFQ